MNERALKLAFVGDVSLSFFRRAPLDIAGFADWPALKQQVGEHDFLVGNLECCLVDESCTDAARRKPMAVPAAAGGSLLAAIGFTDMCLANNHAMDCGAEAVTVTRKRLASLGIRGFGAGLDLDAAEQAVFVEQNGCKVAFLGACDNSEYAAAGNRAGIAPLQKSRLGRRVREAASHADLVVVTLHSDLEFSEVPGGWRRRLSHWLIEQGAHLVVQHHPHVLQGIETYRGGLIAYSLGNFIFRLHGNRYQERHAGVFNGMILVVDADFAYSKPRLSYRVVPFRIGPEHVPCALDGASLEQATRHIAALSAMTSDPRSHRRAWFKRCRAEAAARMLRIYYAGRRGNFFCAAQEFGRVAGCPEGRRWLLGLASLGFF
jgi:poly-gamma-glutamate synthesis protein (capsule biosynthesis protein)